MSAAIASDKQSSRRAWTVAIGALLCMIAASVPLSGLSFYHPYIFAVMGAQGIAQSTVLLYYTLMMLSIVVSMLFIGGALLPKLGTRTLMIGGSLVVAAGLTVFANANSPLMLYVAGIILGLGYGFSYQLVPMVWVNNWFVARKGLVVGLVTGGTGIGGVLWSNLIPSLAGKPAPDNYAYQFPYYIMALVVVGLTIPAALFLATPEKPSSIGLLPLGATPPDPNAIPSPREASRPVPGFTRAQAMRSPWLWLIFACSVLLGITHAAAQIMAPYLTMRVTAEPPAGLGQQLAFFSLAMSVWTIGLIVLKPVLGVLNDKLGIMWAMIIALTLQAAFFLFLPVYANFGTVIPVVMMLAMSAGMSTGTVQPPLITANAMGRREFGKIWAVTGSAYTLGMAVGAPVWGLFYDAATKSYDTGFRLAPIVLAVVVAGSVIGMNAGKRQHLALHKRELAAWEAEEA